MVGAGPAGCAAAYDLARAGHDVLLLDRSDFPRAKPCAGALTIKAVNRLRYSIAPVIRHVARDLGVSLRGRGRRLLHSPAPICVMTVRREFDDFCLKQTVAAGAVFRRIGGLAAIVEVGAGVELRTADGAVLQADYLIGADGAHSQVRRLSDGPPTSRALALEGTVKRAACRGPVAMQFDFDQVEGGYGWLFPKHDHINVGLYSQGDGVRFGKSDLVAYCREALGVAEIDHMVGYPIGVGGHAVRPASERVLLVGDAAGLADPLLGEGLHNAITSGQLAAEAIVQAAPAGASVREHFDARLAGIRRDLASCRRSAGWFYDLPRMGYRALVSPPARYALMRGYAAGMTFRDIVRSFPAAPWYAARPVPAIEEYAGRDP